MAIAEYAFAVFASIAVDVLYFEFRERLQLRRILSLPILIISSAALLAGAVYKFGMYQFGGYDESLIVHAASYYAQGFKPYLDFPSCMPPLFMAGIRLSVSVLGLYWASLAILSAVFAAVTFIWLYVILKSAFLPAHWSLIIAGTVELSTMFLIPFWWYNNTTSIAVVLLLASVFACLRQQDALIPWMSLSLSFAMVLTSKPNVAPVCVVVLAPFFKMPRWGRLRAFLAIVAGIGLAIVICYAAQTPPLELLGSYIEIGKMRGSPLTMVPIRDMGPVETLFQGGLIVLTILCFTDFLVRSAKRRLHQWPELTMCVIAAITSLEMVFTNSEFKPTDLIVMVVASAFLCLRPWDREETPEKKRNLMVGLLSIFLVISGFFGIIHLRILAIGEGAFYEPLPTTTIKNGFFSGLDAGPRLLRVQSEIKMLFSVYPARTVFFGPRMEFESAAFRKPAMREMPLLWYPGNFYSYEEIPNLLNKFQEQDPDLLIFLKNDYTRMDWMASYIYHSPAYRRIDDFQDITVYVRNRQLPFTYKSMSGAQARSTCRQDGIQYLVAYIKDPAWKDPQSWVWTLPSVDARPEFRTIDCR